MIRAYVACVGLTTVLLASCAGAPPPTPNARIVVFTASAERIPRNTEVTLLWQAADAGVQDGLLSCTLTRRFGNDPTETSVPAACSGGLTEVPPAPLTATTVHYQFKVLKQPYDAIDPYLTQTRSVTLDTARFAKAVGGTGSAVGRSASVLTDGGAIVTGSFTGTATFGGSTLTAAGTSNDVFVARIDPNGTWTWATRAGGTGNDTAYGVSALPDGGAIVTGSFTGTAYFGGSTLTSAGDYDVFIARIGPTGSWTWARRAGGGNVDVAHSVSALPDGSAIVAGSFSGTATFGNTSVSAASEDVFVARIDPNGTWTWARRAGGTGIDEARSVSALPDGGAIVTGRFNDVAYFGSTTLASAGGSDVFVARIDPDGTWTWAQRTGGVGADFGNGASALADGSAIVTGYFRTTATFGNTTLTSAGFDDVFVARINPNGSWAWATSAGGTDFEYGRGVSALPDGSAIVTGAFVNGPTTIGATTLTNAGSNDVFVARIDPDGNWTWAQRAGGISMDNAYGVSALPDGGAVLIGSFYTTTTIGDITLTSAGQNTQAAFVARIGADGTW